MITPEILLCGVLSLGPTQVAVQEFRTELKPAESIRLEEIIATAPRYPRVVNEIPVGTMIPAVPEYLDVVCQEQFPGTVMLEVLCDDEC